MSAVPEGEAERQIVAAAEAALADWPRRLAILPTVKPLSAAWMPRCSPNTGRRDGPAGTWWSWSIENPTRLKDETSGTLLPDSFPYANHAAWCAYRASVGKQDDILNLAKAYQITNDDRFAIAIAELLAKFRPIYPSYPITCEQDSERGELRFYGSEVLGTVYAVRVNPAWGDTSDLQSWLIAYRMIQHCPAIARELDDAVRELAQEVLEFQSLPCWLYFLDKYHNSMTNYFGAAVLAGVTWGQRLLVRDVIAGETYTGGDLIQLAVNGPKGIRAFAAHAFDRNGIYWELSSSYTGYSLGYLGRMLPVLIGYSDPPGYKPSSSVVAFYERIESFDPARSMPDLWRAVLGQVRLALTNGLLSPANDASYLNGVSAEWLESWGGMLESERIRRMARGVRIYNGEKVEGEFDPFPPGGSTLMPASGTVTLRGPRGRLSVHMDWHRMQDYHSHVDPLNFVIAADGYLVLSELGYHLGHPLRYIISERTAAHNTVTIDRQDASRHHQRGTLHHYVHEGEVQLVEASVPDAYPAADLYRRAVILVGDRYVVDIFRVLGGRTHDYVLLSRADRSECSLELAAHRGTVADPESDYAGFEQLDPSPCSPSSPYEAMHSPLIGRATEAFTVGWVQRDRPDLTTRVHHLSAAGSEVFIAKAPHRDRRRNMELRTDEVLIVRRTGAPPLASTFVSLIETLSGTTRPVECVRLVAVESPDESAVAVETTHDGGTDLLIHAVTRGPHCVASHGIELRGVFAAICQRRDETRITLLGRTLRGPFGEVRAPQPQAAQVSEVDIQRGVLVLDPPLERPDKLRGRFVAVRGRTGRTEHWLAASASCDGRLLYLDLDHSAMLTMQGRVESVKNPRRFTTGLDLCEAPLPGTPIRIGPVGDFRSPRFHIEVAEQTGSPLRIGGTAEALTVRTFYMHLDRSANLSVDDVGKPFWASGIEVGDYLFTEPVLQTTIRGS